MGRVIAGNIALYAVAGLVWVCFQYGKSNAGTRPLQAAQIAQVTRVAQEHHRTAAKIVIPNSLGNLAEISQGDATHATITRSDFSQAFNRLDRAFAAHPGQRPEELIRAANAQAAANTKPCGIAWSGGEPVLSLESVQGGISLSSSLNTCAAAIEQLR